MIVVDSSVWIDHFRNNATVSVQKFRDLGRPTRIVVGDLVLLEVLQGARDNRHAVRLEQILRQFRVEAMLDDAVAVKAAANYRMLRAQGITVRKTIDLIIATFCVERRHSLLHDDRDFDLIVPHIGLGVI